MFQLLVCNQPITSYNFCALTSLQQADDESLHKFMDMLGWIVVQIRNLNLEVAVQSMLLALRPGKFVDNLWKKSLCKKTHNNMDELCKWAKNYIQLEEMSRFRNEARKGGQKHDKKEGGSKIDSYKSNKRHKQDKGQPLPRGPKYKCYTPLIANRVTILEKAFNVEIPIKLRLTLPPRPGLDRTKHYK